MGRHQRGSHIPYRFQLQRLEPRRLLTAVIEPPILIDPVVADPITSDPETDPETGDTTIDTGDDSSGDGSDGSGMIDPGADSPPTIQMQDGPDRAVVSRDGKIDGTLATF